LTEGRDRVYFAARCRKKRGGEFCTMQLIGDIALAKVTIDAGICGFTTTVIATSDDGQHIHLHIESTCPHVARAAQELSSVDAYTELFSKLHETSLYQILSQHVIHCACPVYVGIMKAIEVAAGMALPKDAAIHVEK
jgi:hypothetical protein